MRSRRLRLFAIASILGLSALGLAAAPAGAATTGIQIENYNSGLCMGTSGGADDAPAVQWNCLGTSHPDQYWHWGSSTMSGYGLTWRTIVNGHGDCLGIQGGSNEEGAQVVGWSCQSGASNQYWAYETGTCPGATVYQYENLNDGIASDEVLGVKGNSTAAGADLVMWVDQFPDCNNQMWLSLPS